MNRTRPNLARTGPQTGKRARADDFVQRPLIQTTSEEPMALFHRVADNFT
jgi:hypothetical protein